MLLEVEPQEQVGMRDEFVADGLVEVEEHEGHVIPDILLDLADPLRVVLAVLYHAEVGLQSQLHLLEDLRRRVVARLTPDCLKEGLIHC